MPAPMTREEAEKKWCPFARLVEEDGTCGNRFVSIREQITWVGANCIHCECMAWIEAASEDKGFCAMITVRGG